MHKPIANIIWFKDTTRSNHAIVGGKGANLGEMTKLGLPVPNGYTITTQAYFNFLESNQLIAKLNKLFQDLDLHNQSSFTQQCQTAQKLILQAKIPEEISQAILTAYHQLAPHQTDVAVRSSSPLEDQPTGSGAGQQDTFLNIKGEKNLLQAVLKCWASFFNPRAMAYRLQTKQTLSDIGIAISIQLMVQAEVSGVMFTINPVNYDQSLIIIESVWGLGETIVQGNATPDHFEVDKNSFRIISKQISFQEKQLIKIKGVTKLTPVSQLKINSQKVSDSVIVRIAKLGYKLQSHFHSPQDIEWVFQDGRVYIVQSRPIATSAQSDQLDQVDYLVSQSENPILSGACASPGIVAGKVRLIHQLSDISSIKQGEILVATLTSPEYVSAMKRAAAIITNEGGQTSHAAIVCRELGVPCIVGTGKATQILKDGMLVTVDATGGKVYSGELAIKSQKISLPKNVSSIRDIKTRTKILLNAYEPETALALAQKYSEGIGLIKAEYIISEYIGIHPKFLLAKARSQFFIDKLAESLADISINFTPRPLIYRFSDFITSDYFSLQGGEKYELQEANPIIGLRGARRFLIEDEVFDLEIAAIKKVRDKLGHKHLHVMLPHVRTIEELMALKHTLAQHGLSRRHNFRLYLMINLPSNVFLLDEFIDVGIDGVVVNLEDLTMLTLGYDQANDQINSFYMAENLGVQKALEIIIKTCKRRGITSSICIQSATISPTLISSLVLWGASSLSVNSTVLDQTRLIVYHAEQST